MKCQRLLLMTVVLAGVLFSAAACQDNQQTKAVAANEPALSQAGKDFIAQVQQESVAERELATIAKDKSANKNIKHYADMVIKDNSDALQKLSEIAQKYKLDSTAATNTEETKRVMELKKLSRRALDRQFLKVTSEDHERALKSARNEAGSASDPEVRDFARSMTPVLESELQTAKDLQSPVKAAARNKITRKPQASSF